MGAATMGAAMLAAGCAARVTPKGKAGLDFWVRGLPETVTCLPIEDMDHDLAKRISTRDGDSTKFRMICPQETGI